jgi:hypothetical protein
LYFWGGAYLHGDVGWFFLATDIKGWGIWVFQAMLVNLEISFPLQQLAATTT